MTLAQEANLDSELHVKDGGESCCSYNRMTCGRCNGFVHKQPVYHGIAYLCEDCPADQHDWKPGGTYPIDEGGFVDYKHGKPRAEAP